VRYVLPLTKEHCEILEDTMKKDISYRARVRAHSILLSAQGMHINEIAKIYHVNRDTVSAWIKKWENDGVASLHDKPRCGRPQKLTTEEQEIAKHYIKAAPRSLRQVVEQLAQTTAKRVSISSLKRLAKKARLRWKRVRKSLKGRRDPAAFTQCQHELKMLQHQEDQGLIALYYFDASGFSLDPYIPYAWQESGTTIEVPASKSGRLNVLGFLNRQHDFHPFIFEQSINTSVVVACFNAFSKTLAKQTAVVIDNSPLHTSEEFVDHIPRWKKKGLIIKYLPPYCPELNIIEILWRTIKYTWLPFTAYQCLDTLVQALEDILRNYGAKYQITFA
jgi:transposase